MKPLAAALLAALVLTLGVSPAIAGRLQVVVTGPDGKPAADVVVLAHPGGSWPTRAAAPALSIVQENTRFQPYVTVVPLGGSIKFVNKDRYDHHLRSQPGGPLGNQPAARQFDFRMAAATAFASPESAELKFDQPGVLAIGCHLHGSMRGHVFVSATPWAAVTDDQGRATLADVPEGAVELRFWHPDQLVDQASVALTLGANAQAAGKLNFTPRPRPAGQNLRSVY